MENCRRNRAYPSGISSCRFRCSASAFSFRKTRSFHGFRTNCEENDVSAGGATRGRKRRRTSRRVSSGFLHPPWRAPRPAKTSVPAATAHYVYCIPVESVLLLLFLERESATPISLSTRLQLHFHVPHFGQADSFIVKNTSREERFLAD